MLARQGHLLSGQRRGRLRDQADRTLRTLLSAPFFSVNPFSVNSNVVAFSPDGTLLAAYSWNSGQVYLWNLSRHGDQPNTLPKPVKRDLRSLAFSPDGRALVAGLDTPSGDRSLLRWDLERPSVPPVVLEGHEGDVFKLAFSPDGRLLAAGGTRDVTVRRWDLVAAVPVRLGAGPSAGVPETSEVLRPVAFSPDGLVLASGDAQGTVKLWDPGDPTTPVAVLRGHEKAVHGVAFSPDGKTLVSAGQDKTVRLWRLGDPSAAAAVLRGARTVVWSALFSPDGKALVAAVDFGMVRFWDHVHTTAEPVEVQLATKAWVGEIAFSPDGRTLAAGAADGTLHLGDARRPRASWTVLRTDAVQAPSIPSIAFSPDGKTLASNGDDGTTIRLWNLLDPDAQPTALRGHEALVRRLRFSPDGNRLASASQDTSVRLWDMTHPLMRLTTQGLADRVCEKVWRNLTLDEWHQFVAEDIPYDLTCPNLPVHPSVRETAEQLAKEGDVDGAVVLFQRLVELDPGLDLNPEAEAKRLAAAASKASQ